MNTDIVRGHTFCSYHDNDGKYHSLKRDDETNLKILTREESINYTQLEECYVSGYRPGVMCGNECSVNIHWCRSDLKSSCENGESQFSKNDKNLCGNAKFWSNKTCNMYKSSGEVFAFGLRCSGKYQHCYHPWYQTENTLYEEIIKKII